MHKGQVEKELLKGAGLVDVENAQAIRFLLKSPFNFLQIITTPLEYRLEKLPGGGGGTPRTFW